MSATITRLVTDLAGLTGPGKLYPERRTLTFCEEPVSREAALAHLELYAPHGWIVLVRRGPKGGYGLSRYSNDARRINARRGTTFHIVVGEDHGNRTDS